jgi:hypothetical protein
VAAARLHRVQAAVGQGLSSWPAAIDYCRIAMALADKKQFRLFFVDKSQRVEADVRDPRFHAVGQDGNSLGRRGPGDPAQTTGRGAIWHRNAELRANAPGEPADAHAGSRNGGTFLAPRWFSRKETSR